jgi:hypothetical protein
LRARASFGIDGTAVRPKSEGDHLELAFRFTLKEHRDKFAARPGAQYLAERVILKTLPASPP